MRLGLTSFYLLDARLERLRIPAIAFLPRLSLSKLLIFGGHARPLLAKGNRQQLTHRFLLSLLLNRTAEVAARAGRDGRRKPLWPSAAPRLP